MKKTIGIILIVMVALNAIAIFTRISRNVSVGSPGYLIFLVLLLIGGLQLINSQKRQ